MSNITTATAVVYQEYDMENPPPAPPSPDWTRFVCISDTHSRTFRVPPGDVLLHSGDLTNTGLVTEFRTTIEWLRAMPHPTKIIIAGNHDLSLDQHDDWYTLHYSRWHRKKQDIEVIRELLIGPESKAAGLVYLEDAQYQFQTKPDGKVWSVYGSPWSPDFYNWGFNYDRGVQADDIVKAIPKVDILLTHGPPAGILDTVVDGTAVGCESLKARMSVLRPRLHVFGHIHEAHGAVIRNWDSNSNTIPTDDLSTSQSVHINAANWPAGPRSRVAGQRFAFGTGHFQPVIVDLLNSVSAS
ncbi:Metallo-dependent phosphatase [Irpex rosettiformis]|uniref:Metallo-dependent phosphatase n=1 Tax=Irpex rosettiformis TaxID=378272 RepID=A0ACB8U4S3_9APHY|nr:Metallo-dependent phosphatase [Irpex rosettiformis]